MRDRSRPGLLREFFSGVAFLGRGMRMYVSAPAIMWPGIVPALIVFAVYLTGVIALVLNLDGLVRLADPLTKDLDPALRIVVQVLAGAALLGLALVLFVFTFTAVTLAVGDPFYERIWRRTETLVGDAPPESTLGFWTRFGRTLADTLRLLLLTILVSVVVLVIGFIPVVGTVAGAILGALVGGWFLTLELCGFAFEARGLRLRDRRRALAVRRARTLGFGVATYLLFLVPFVAIVVMPAAVAGATLLTRDALGEVGTRGEPVAEAARIS